MIKLQMLGLLEESGFEQDNRVFYGGGEMPNLTSKQCEGERADKTK